MKKIILLIMLSVLELSCSKPLIPVESKYYTPYINDLRFRESFEISSKIIRLLEKEEKLIIIEKGKEEIIDNIKGNWVKVETEKKEIGWCFGGYLTEYNKYVNKSIDNKELKIEEIDFKKYISGKQIYLRSDDVLYARYKVLINPMIKVYLSSDSSSNFYYYYGTKKYSLIETKQLKDTVWYFISNEDFNCGWIKYDSIVIPFEDYYPEKILKQTDINNLEYVWEKMAFKEFENLKNKQNGIERNGPVLILKHDNYEILFNDKVDEKGSSYSFLEKLNNKYVLLLLRFYEGGYYSIYDLDKKEEAYSIFSYPYYSPDKKYFITIGTFYSEEYHLKIFSIEGEIINSEYENDYPENFDITQESNMYDIKDINWITNNEFVIDLTNNDTDLDYKIKGKKMDKWIVESDIPKGKLMK